MLLVVSGTVLAYVVFCVMRARSNLVTLDVRNADVRTVIGKIEWQTWEDIYVSPDVKGTVTLKVRKVPLEEVLRVIGEQTASRSIAVYPIYSSKSTLSILKATVSAGKKAGDSPWKSWQEQPSFRFAGMLGNALRNESGLVNVQIEVKDALSAAQSLSRVSSGRVVPEDNTPGKVSLKLSQAILPDAVEQLARQVKRSWTVFYVLSAAPFMGRPGSVNTATSLTPDQKVEQARQFEANLATLSPEEQKQARQRREMEAIRSLPPKERVQAMQQVMQKNPEMQSQMQQQMMERVTGAMRDSTPDQRVERSRMFNEMRKSIQ